jgi:23S rRNA (adenine2503-C2)-methyltransferase
LRVLASAGKEGLARVYVAESRGGRLVEFVESVQPPVPLARKWVLIVSTLYGCPIGCPFCDAGNFYEGKISAGEMLEQIDYMVRARFPGGEIGTARLKIQFARMGEPALNDEVLRVLERLPSIYPAHIVFPSVSTVAPAGRDAFFEELLNIKNRFYGRSFQLQFSIHSTDPRQRAWLVPAATWDLEAIAGYGASFMRPGERKVTLNFALALGAELDGRVLRSVFDPDKFLIKITPVNPTYQAMENGIASRVSAEGGAGDIARELRDLGFEVILSIGETEENHIGSNCGQHLTHYIQAAESPAESYTYPVMGRA